jgi:hypothetical protein
MSVRENALLLPTDRTTALAVGASHFYTGVPCKRGHLDIRTTIRNSCVACIKLASNKYKKTAKAATTYAIRVERLKASGEWSRGNTSRLLKHEYGITLLEYEALFAKQNGVCAICQQPEKTLDKKSNSPRRLAVDHCHITDKIRGLLCFECNTGIGKFGDNPQLIERAANYVRNKGELNCQ